MNKLFNIPKHDNCTGCGGCCGIIPAMPEEVHKIRKYIKKQGIKPRKSGINCPFRNEEEKKCDIYPVRPVICRLMGVAAGMQCPNGNSHEIDGSKFIKEKPVILNFLEW